MGGAGGDNLIVAQSAQLSFLPVLRRFSHKSEWVGQRRKAGNRPPFHTLEHQEPTNQQLCYSPEIQNFILVS